MSSESAPSFACIGKLSPSESTICGSRNLSALDRQMASAYAAKIASVSETEKQTIKTEQKNWFTRREACRDDAACITSTYTNRLDELVKSNN
ncbi:lysozyme inhibitor LprI family protein [Bradyrhizobium sp. LeoA1S1]